MAKKPKKLRAYRLPEHIISEIERLSEEWECTHGEVIERAIERVGDASGSRWRKSKLELRMEYDE